MHTSTSFSTSKIIALFIVAAVAFTVDTAFAGTDFNSSVSNSSSTLSISQINEQVGNILLRYNIGGAEINKVTDALAVGIAEEKLMTLLVEVGVSKESVKAVLAEFDKLGIASDDTTGSAVSAPSAVSPVPVNETACTKELKICPDGTSVGRTGPNCEFSACPSIVSPKTGENVVPVPSTIIYPAPPSTNVATPPVSTTAVQKCGVNTYRPFNECGVGAFKGAYVQCYDGYEENLGGESSCRSSEVWQKYAQEVCANRCSVVGTPQPTTPGPKPLPTPSPTQTNIRKPIVICYIPDNLTKDYKRLILDLEKAEETGDDEVAELIIKKITALKLEIEEARKKCLANAPQPVTIQRPTKAPRPLAPVAIDRCQEVAQWENKIAYYQKLAGLNDSELKEQTGFSRAEIEKILADLPNGLVKVKAQCQTQTNTASAKPAAVSQISIAEPVKPVAVGSGQEIDEYYKAKIERITTEENAEVQIQKLKSLKGEIDELIAKLIKGRKEIEASELGNAVAEIKVSRGEIKADDVSVKTTDKKIFVNVGESSVSVAPTSRRVEIIEIKDSDDTELKVTASEVSIKDNALLVGNSEVKLAASKVAENLGVEPQSAELKEENSRAVYKLKVAEPRKLFGFIPIRITKTMTADAESSDLLGEKLPWYSFLTTK